MSVRVQSGSSSASGSPIVLVVNDDSDVGEATAANLRVAGLRVRTALNSDRAVACCEAQSFNAVVLDHHQADDYSESLLANGPDMGPAVIVSAARLSQLADIRSRYPDKVFAVLAKPVAPSELVEVVRAAITASRNQRKQ